MPKDNLSKYVKGSSSKKKSVPQKAGSWLGNVAKSIGFSTFDVLQELLPSTIDVAKVTATTGKDIAESMKKSRASDRVLRTAIDKNYYFNLGREVFKNSLEDLKSGKFYNKERADKFFNDMNDDMMDMGDFGEENFDFGEEDMSFDSSVESSDGSSVATFSRKTSHGNETTSINVNTDLGPDSVLVQTTAYQTETMVNVGQAVVDYNNANARATLNMIGNIRNEINASLTSINDNITTISTTGVETLSKFSTLSAKYYEDSIALQTQILEQIKSQATSTQVNTRTFKDYNNVMDLFSSGGAIDSSGYMDLVKKQFGQYVDSNMFLSQIKFMADNKETLKMMAQNPLSFIPKAITKQLIPATVKSILTEFDNQVKETGIGFLSQLSGLQRSENLVLQAIGKIFGVNNKITLKSVDKSAYNKGAMSWSGTDHQALTNVIPTLLRKINASISGTEEIGFNYDTGKWETVRSIEERYQKDKLQRETSMYSDMQSDFREFISQNAAIGKEELEKYADEMKKLTHRLVLDEYGGRNPFKKEDMAYLTGNASEQDTFRQLATAFFGSMRGVRNSDLTRWFNSTRQEQRAAIDRHNKEEQQDWIKYNTQYIDTGLGDHRSAHVQSGSGEGSGKRYSNGTDSHLSYYKGDNTKVRAVTGGIGAGVIDKYGHNQNHYLREILNTLNTGIYVVPIGSLSSSGSDSGDGDSRLTAINNRIQSVNSQFTKDKSELDRNTPKIHTTTYTDEKKQKDIDKGKLDLDEAGIAQMEARAKDYHRQKTGDTKNDAGFLGKVVNWLPQDSGARKLIENMQNTINQGTSKVKDAVQVADNLLFDIVFGNQDGHRGIKALFDKTVNTMKAGFIKFSSFIDAKVLEPLNEALFGEEGIIKKIQQTELWKKVSETFTNITKKASTFFLGTNENGTYTGGLFSETANSLKDIGTHVKEGILGKRGADGKIIEPDESVLGNMKKIFRTTTENIAKAVGLDADRPKESLGTRIANGVDSIYNRIQERGKEFSDIIFGQYSGSKEFMNQFKEDMKGQKGFIGASAVLGSVGTMVLSGHMGLLGSLFLPGGPIGGAILGAGIGIATKSTAIQNLLFGPEDDNGESTGGLITKEFQDFFKQNKMGIGIGAGAGLAASFGLIPSFFVPGGPIGGALIGGAVSIATKSEAFNTLLYGESGDKDNPTGGITKKLKEIFGKEKDLKNLGIDAGIGAGVGLLGSFFLPGGPVLGALLGSATSVALASDKFKNWFFGEEKEGKRQGGVLGKFTDFIDDKIFDPLGKATKIAQIKILGFVDKHMATPFKKAMLPLITEAKYVGGIIKEKITGVFDSIKEAFHTHITKPIGETIDKYFLSPIKKMLSSFFSGLGKFIGGIISAPFKVIGAAARGAYNNQRKRGEQSYVDEVEGEYKTKVSNIMHFEKDPNKGFFGNAIDAIKQVPGKTKDYFKARKDRRTKLNDQESRVNAQFGEKGAWYDETKGHWFEEEDAKLAEREAKRQERIAKIQNGEDDAERKSGGIRAFFENLLKPRQKLEEEKRRRAEASKAERPAEESTIERISESTDEQTTEISKQTESLERITGFVETIANRLAGNTSSPSSSSVNTKPNEEIDSTDQTSDSKRSKKNKSRTKFSRKQKTKQNRATRDNTRVSTGRGYKPSKPIIDTDDGSIGILSRIHDMISHLVSSRSGSEEGVEDSDKKKSFVQKIYDDVSKITDSVYGQLNGVGSNVNKIYRVLLKLNNMSDDDIQGNNNKEYVGFFGKLRTMLNRPFKAIKDIITAPFRMVGNAVKGVVDGIKGAGRAITTGVTNIVKGFGKALAGIGSLVGDIVKLPLDIVHTGLSAVRSMLPALGEAVKAGASLITTGIKAGGILLVDGVKSIGNTVVEASKGFGKLLGGAMQGLGGLLSAAGVIGGDVLKGLWKGAKFVGKGALTAVGTVASAPFKLLGGLGKPGGLFNKGPMHVIVDSGKLDLVKVVANVKKVPRTGGPLEGGSGGFNISHPVSVSTSPLLGGKGDGDENITLIDASSNFFNKLRSAISPVTDDQETILTQVAHFLSDIAEDVPVIGKFLSKAVDHVGDAIAHSQFNRDVASNGLLNTVRDRLTGGSGGIGISRPLRPALAGGFGVGDATPVHVVVDSITSGAIEDMMSHMANLGQVIGNKARNTFGKIKSVFMPDGDTNAGDTSVDASLAGGGSADDAVGSDASLADDDNRTSVATNLAGDKENASPIAEKIAKRQAQVDKGSRATMMERFAALDKEKAETDFRAKLLAKLGQSTQVQTEHKNIFSEIFSKKGLITGALLLALPLIIKHLPGIINFIKNIAEKLDLGGLLGGVIEDAVQGIDEVGGLTGVVNNVSEKVDQMYGVIEGKEKQHEINADGSLAVDENGNFKYKEVDQNRIKTLLTPTKTRINTETGKFENRNDWTQMSGATAKLAGTHVVIPTLKAVDKGVQIATKVGKGVANFAASGRALNGLKAAGYTELAKGAGVGQKIAGATMGVIDNATNAAVTGVKTVGTKIANSAVGQGVKNFGDNAAILAKSYVDDAARAVGNSEIIQTFITKATEVIQFLVGKLAAVGEKIGVKIPTSLFDDFVKGVMKHLGPKSLLTKAKAIGEFLKTITGKSTVAGATAFIAEIGFIVYGAVEGAVNAAALFEVNPQDVDFKMRAISAVFKGLLGTTAGSVIDFINTLLSDLVGMNFVKSIASWTYGLLSDEEGKETLKAAQEDFTKGYHDYVEEEYNAYKENAEKAGQTAMSLEDFKASDLATSRSEYNSKINPSLFKRGFDAVKGGIDAIKGAVTAPGQAVDAIKNAGKTAVTTVTNAASGAWNGIKSFGGNVISGVQEFGSNAIDKAKEIGSTVVTGVSNTASNLWNGAKNFGSSVVNGVQNLGSNIVNSELGQTVVGGFNSARDAVAEVFSKIGGSMSKLGTDGLAAAKGMLSGWQQIAANFYNKENSFMDFFKADVNPLSEDNIFHGPVGALLNVSKVYLFPKLLIGGIFKKVGTAIWEFVSNLVSGIQTAASDVTTNVTTIGAMALKGDIQGINGFEMSISEDNPIGGFLQGTTGIVKFLATGLANITNVGRAIKIVIGKAIDSAKTVGSDVVTNVSTLWGMALNGNIEGISSYEVQVSENNPIGGFVSGATDVAKFIATGIGHVTNIGRSIANTVKGAIESVKMTASDMVTNVSTLWGMAVSGNIEGISSYTTQVSENNPIGGFVEGATGIAKFIATGIGHVTNIGRSIAESVKNAIGVVATTGSDIGTNVANLWNMALRGDTDGISSYEVKVSEDNPIGGFVSGATCVAKFIMGGVGNVTKVGMSISNGIKNAIDTSINAGKQVATGSVELGKLALNGDVSAFKSYTVDENGNPVGGFANAVLGVEKILLSPLANTVATGKNIVGFVKTAVTTIGDYGSKSIDFVKKLNEYTDPDKSMNAFNRETMAQSDDDVVGTVLSSIIKKVMGIYVGIVRSIKGAFEWVGDIGENIADAASNVAGTVSDAASSAYDSLKDAGSWIGNGINNIGTSIMNLGRGGTDTGVRPLYQPKELIGGFGEGPETLNGMPYYSQNDPKYKNKPYHLSGGNGGDTIGDAGCGPTAMAMVASKVTGKDYNPAIMSKMAEKGGYATQVGTTPGYFGAAGSALGIPTAQVQPSANNLVNSLANGNPVILQGASGGFGNGPYTQDGHYVTATGIDSRNNVLINDPRGKQYSGAYRMSDVLSGSTGMWSFGGYGVKPGKFSIRTLLGGRGADTEDVISRQLKTQERLQNNGGETSVTTSVVDSNAFTASDVINIAKNEIGYLEKASNANLNDPKANAGSNNYTKYEQEVFGSNGAFWCASFVSWCFVQAANGDKTKAAAVLCKLSRACEEIRTAMASAGLYDRTAAPGDIIFFVTKTPGRADHIGIVIGVNGNSVITVEGNTSSQEFNDNGGCVASHTYDINSSKILGFGHPKYDGASNFKGITAANSSSGDVSSTSPSTPGSTSVSSTGSGFSSFSDLFNGLVDAVTKPILGIWGLDSSSDSSSTSGTSTESTSPSGSVGQNGISSGSTSATGVKLSGSNEKEQIWNYLTTKQSLNPIGAAGLMGAWQAESSNSPRRMEGDYLSDFPGYDQLYNDQGAMDSWTQKLFSKYAAKGLKINQAAYKGTDGHYYPGLGLAQFTGPRGQRLKEFGGSDWDKLSTQLEYAMNGSGEFNARAGLRDKLNNSATPEDAATMALDYYENSDGNYHNKKPDYNAQRRGYAREIYNLYKDLKPTGVTTDDKSQENTSGGKGGFGTGRPLYRGGKGGINTPYTQEGHYVTATGIDKQGNVIINDPRGKQYSGAYRMSDLMKGTTGMWSFGAGGFGTEKTGEVEDVISRKLKTQERLQKGNETEANGENVETDGTKVNTYGDTNGDYQKWLSIVKSVKEAIAAQHPGYSQENWIVITVGGKSLKVRTDCSGYVAACLKYYGVLNEGSNLTSSNVTNPSDAVMQGTGFTPSSWTGWENLKEGDILGTSGHTEIFAYNKDGAHYVYNCGSDSSTNSPTPTRTGHSAYTTVWRCGAAGSNSVSGSAESSSSGESSSGESFGSTSVSSANGESLSSLIMGLADAVQEGVNNYFGLSSPTSTTGGVDSGSSSTGVSTTGGSASADNLSGSDTAQKVWNYFTKAGYSKAATAGILGNMQQESGVNPASIQGNGKGPAAGIVQWENYSTKSGRWKNMADYAASKGKDWTDLGSQLEFIDRENRDPGSVFWNGSKGMANAGTTVTTFDAWRSSSDVETATRQFEGAFERAGKPAMANRIAAANKFYQMYASGTGTGNTGVSTTGDDNMTAQQAIDAYHEAYYGGAPKEEVDALRAKAESLSAAGKGGFGGGRPIKSGVNVTNLPKRVTPKVRTINDMRPRNGGFGISNNSFSVQDGLSTDTMAIIQSNNLSQSNAGSLQNMDASQLLKMAVGYLSQIVSNTGITNTELSELNDKDFGSGTINQVNNTNNIVDNSMKQLHADKQSNDQKIADRSEYAMAKRVASGLLN